MEKANRIKLKICGLMRKEDVSLCCELGVDVAGFVVDYPLPVPWSLAAREAEKLLSQVRPPMKSCIVTGGDREKILALAMELRPDFIQLHFRETLDDAEYLAQALRKFQVGVIKTLPFSPKERLTQFGTAKIRECVGLLNKTGISAILADARAPSNASGAGTPVDIGLFKQIQRHGKKPVILAGGVAPENAARIIAAARPEYIDIMTGVESFPGVKDRGKVAAIIKQLR